MQNAADKTLNDSFTPLLIASVFLMDYFILYHFLPLRVAPRKARKSGVFF